ncbi:Oxidoreductase AflY [Fonsecaea pedrosoi]|nr:Oxidoreductase AflY [Fonsecaea pedrosoi]
MATASHIELNPAHAGVYHTPDISTASGKIGSQLLQENHDNYHIYFNNSGFHNHIVHHLLTIYALGASPEEIQKAFDINKSYQRPQYPVNQGEVEILADQDKFKGFLGKEKYFHDFEVFFQNEVEQKGWENVINEHVFARNEHAERMLVRMFAGFLHPLIHLGFGVEFKQPAIIVEALAQAAVHDGWTGEFLHAAEDAAKGNTTSKSLVQLLHEARANEQLRKSAHWEDGNKVRDGVLRRAPDEMISLASQWHVRPDELEQKTAEMINAAVYFTGAAQKPTKQVKFDFFYMHCVNSSIFFSAFLKEPWLKTEDKCRLLEWKGRLDLALYVSRGCPELLIDEIKNYRPKKSSDGWTEIIRRVDRFPDDGHASKLVRAIANSEQVSKQYESQGDDVFPIKGDMFLKLAHMAIDSVEASEPTWVRSTGFDQAWEKVPARAKL